MKKKAALRRVGPLMGKKGRAAKCETAARRRLKAPISTSRWLVYATVGVATALGGASSLEAAIEVFDPGDVLNAPPAGFDLAGFALNGGNTFAVNFRRYGSFTRSGSGRYAGDGVVRFILKGVGSLYTPPSAGAAFRGFKGADGEVYVSNLAFGDKIASGPFAGTDFNGLRIGFMAGLPSSTNDKFDKPGTGYVGFTFKDAGGTETGWLEVTMAGSPGNNLTLDEYAFGTAGESLYAGEVPEPGSLGLLAVGGAGLLAWRQRRARAKVAALPS
jgi:hypothetical protein